MGKRGWWLLGLSLMLLLAFFFLSQPLIQETGSGADGKGSASLGLVLLNQSNGVYVLAVSERSPAWNAGLLAGDSIVAADGWEDLNQERLDSLLDTDEPEIMLTILRDGKTIQIMLPTN